MTTRQAGPGYFAELLYRANRAPWDIGECQPTIRRLVAEGVVTGRVLDPGCGTGWHAIEYAGAGCVVTGIDVSTTAIIRARRNTRAAGVAATFKLGDITAKLDAHEGQFDCVVDSKLYDNLDATVRPGYVAALHRVTRPGGRLFLYAFGPGDLDGIHNHALDEPDYETVLPAAGFDITLMQPSSFELVVRDWQPICADCPRHIPDGRMTIPMVEVHAVRV